ncbi:unnamed protein product, partial [Polarella glacialis]
PRRASGAAKPGLVDTVDRVQQFLCTARAGQPRSKRSAAKTRDSVESTELGNEQLVSSPWGEPSAQEVDRSTSPPPAPPELGNTLERLGLRAPPESWRDDGERIAAEPDCAEEGATLESQFAAEPDCADGSLGQAALGLTIGGRPEPMEAPAEFPVPEFEAPQEEFDAAHAELDEPQVEFGEPQAAEECEESMVSFSTSSVPDPVPASFARRKSATRKPGVPENTRVAAPPGRAKAAASSASAAAPPLAVVGGGTPLRTRSSSKPREVASAAAAWRKAPAAAPPAPALAKAPTATMTTTTTTRTTAPPPTTTTRTTAPPPA